jgi:hypothetical protein
VSSKRFVHQDRFGDEGNCYSACLASVFGVPLTDVPNFHDIAKGDDEAWFVAVRDWLRPKGFGVMCVSTSEAGLEKYEGLLIVCGQSPRDPELNRLHAVVFERGAMVHDPHPDNTGILCVDSVDLLYPLDPSTLLLKAAETIQEGEEK